MQPTESEYNAGIWKSAPMPQTLKELASQIRQTVRPDWFWVDFYAGFRFSVKQTRADAENWNDNLWEKAGLIWKAWLY